MQTEQLAGLGVPAERIYIDHGFSGTSRRNRAGLDQARARRVDLRLERPVRPAVPLKGKQPKLSDAAQRSIRTRYADGELSLADLAEEYRVGRSTIHRIMAPES